MRSFVMSARSRPRDTSSRNVFMLTGITAWTIGSTKAPPFITTFCPPSPVRTNARSLDERRYSQCSSQTTIATTIAITMSPKMNAPNWAPVIPVSSLSPPHCLEPPRRLGQCPLGRQPLHAGGAVEAVTLRAVLQDVVRFFRRGDRTAVAQHDCILVHRQRCIGPRIDERDALRERERGIRADHAASGQAEMANDDVGAGARHLG